MFPIEFKNNTISTELNKMSVFVYIPRLRCQAILSEQLSNAKCEHNIAEHEDSDKNTKETLKLPVSQQFEPRTNYISRTADKTVYLQIKLCYLLTGISFGLRSMAAKLISQTGVIGAINDNGVTSSESVMCTFGLVSMGTQKITDNRKKSILLS